MNWLFKLFGFAGLFGFTEDDEEEDEESNSPEEEGQSDYRDDLGDSYYDEGPEDR